VTKPRVLNGHLQVFVFDPDGYKLEVATDHEAETGAVRRQVWPRTPRQGPNDQAGGF
jgi:hypothetical protein